MSRLWKKQLTNERGATAAIVALSLVAVIGAAAIAIDLGMLYDARNDAQRAADAAALAGASVFMSPGVPQGEEVARATARAHTFGGHNVVQGIAISPEEMQVEVMTDEQKVRVTVTRSDIPLWFARIFGLNTSAVTARATAAAVLSGSVPCLRPLGFADLWHERAGEGTTFSGRLPDQPPCAWGDGSCDYYETAETGRSFWWRNAGMPRPDGKGMFEAPDKPNDQGRKLMFRLNRRSIAEGELERMDRHLYYPYAFPGCNGASCYRDAIAGRDCSWTGMINDPVDTEPGAQIGPTDQGFGLARDDDPRAYWDDVTNTIQSSRYPLGCVGAECTGEGSPRIFNVALIHPISRVLSNRSDAFPMINFGSFFLEDWVVHNPGGGQVIDITVRWMKVRALSDDCVIKGTCRDNLSALRLVE
jgi:hypothetical protein